MLGNMLISAENASSRAVLGLTKPATKHSYEPYRSIRISNLKDLFYYALSAFFPFKSPTIVATIITNKMANQKSGFARFPTGLVTSNEITIIVSMARPIIPATIPNIKPSFALGITVFRYLSENRTRITIVTLRPISPPVVDGLIAVPSVAEETKAAITNGIM